ncbi:MAG: hypothetical protein GIX03_07185 [Candidatus Eremiobacteraeota bacterium]|nr:hypothetical protein [Candidatus Eremiobacteraeota bacterium]MBC5802775.1 hypothetical protein [Candidatus Eremiobacteraeota bacterium]MBC5820894.1 hypothetical protein [Candidatus Eremiobacteraeota bacterium]
MGRRSPIRVTLRSAARPSARSEPAEVPIVDPKTCTATTATSGFPFLLIPDAYTGRFDDPGAFKEPERLTLNLAGSYDASKNMRLSFAVTG